MTPIKTASRAIALALALVLPAVPAVAEDATKGDLTILHPKARPNLPNRPTAAYMMITNAGTDADRLIRATSTAFGTIEIHTVEKHGNVMKMLPVDAIEIPAGGEAMLAPGGFHLMLFDSAKPFKIGETIPMTLTFERTGEIDVTVRVERITGGMSHGGAGGHGGHSGHGNHGKAKQ